MHRLELLGPHSKRHHLAGRPVEIGAQLEMLTPSGWERVSYEGVWHLGVAEARIRLPGGAELAPGPLVLFRWPQSQN